MCVVRELSAMQTLVRLDSTGHICNIGSLPLFLVIKIKPMAKARPLVLVLK